MQNVRIWRFSEAALWVRLGPVDRLVDSPPGPVDKHRGRAGTVATYEVVVTHRVRQQLADAPSMLVGFVAGVTAVLRVDPTQASMSFQLRRIGDDAWTVTFGAGRGLLTYWVVRTERIVVVLELTWTG
jgi:hypothetical protein